MAAAGRAFSVAEAIIKLNRSAEPDRPAHAFEGDPRCWTQHALVSFWPRAGKEDDMVVRYPWLVKGMCCSAGHSGLCWHGDYNFDRCCTARGGEAERSVARGGECWTDAAVRAACCQVRVRSLCGLEPSGGLDIFERCCGDRAPPLAAQPFRVGCRTRLMVEETYALLFGEAMEVPPLRPVDLTLLTRHFYRTGDAVPSLLIIADGLVRRHGDALEMCPAAAVLAHLLVLERGLQSSSLPRLRRKLKLLQHLWGHLAPRLVGGGPNASKQPQDAELGLVRTVSAAFGRVEGKLLELEALVRRRKSFRAHLILPLCWPNERGSLRYLLSSQVLHEGLQQVGTLYLYDDCYALFPPGSGAYDLRNELEVELDEDLKPREQLRGQPLPRMPLPGTLSELGKRFHRTVLVPFHEEIPMGMISVVMRHFAVHYNQLPDLLLLLHPDVMEHVQWDAVQAVFASVGRRQWPPETHYLPLGHRHNGPVDASGRVTSEVLSYCGMRAGARQWSAFKGGSHLMRVSDRTPSGAYCQWLELAWEILFDKPLQLPEDDYGGYDFGQSAVTREAVQRRPQEFWARWRAMCSRGNYELLPGTRFVSSHVELSAQHGKKHWTGYHKAMECVFEHLWHVLFNPRAKSWLWPTRLRDPTLPLGFKFEVGRHNQRMLREYRWTAHAPL